MTVSAGETPKRLDIFLSTHSADLSRAAIQRLIEQGAVTVNGKRPKPSQKIRPGDAIEWDVPQPTPLEIAGEPIPLEILFEDEHLLVLNKPTGLVVHPAPGHWSGTLVNALLHHLRTEGTDGLAGIGGRERPGLVHRLDKGTSGVMVIAKTDAAHQGLSKQFKAHTIHRVYLALVRGAVKGKMGRVELAIGRDTKNRKKFSARTTAPREAVTEFQVVEQFGAKRSGNEATLVEVHPWTGRTHQIRVHLASLGHPVLGDETYGGRKVCALGDLAIERPMLHARTLGFTHPATGKPLEYTVPPPADMERLLERLRRAG
ncbi:MAG TPA: RluA family pseudouridine synthase [Nitrospirales bacterium]|nr:RluA family pseudouridine synthase [Nitrospirales bacterium]